MDTTAVKTEFWQYILGDVLTGGKLLAAIFFCILGGALHFLVELKNRDKKSARTPEKFNFWFMLKDNAIRFAISAFCMFIVMRFSMELLNFEFTMLVALVFGFSGDLFAKFIVKKLKLYPAQLLGSLTKKKDKEEPTNTEENNG